MLSGPIGNCRCAILVYSCIITLLFYCVPFQDCCVLKIRFWRESIKWRPAAYTVIYLVYPASSVFLIWGLFWLFQSCFHVYLKWRWFLVVPLWFNALVFWRRFVSSFATAMNCKSSSNLRVNCYRLNVRQPFCAMRDDAQVWRYVNLHSRLVSGNWETGLLSEVCSFKCCCNVLPI